MQELPKWLPFALAGAGALATWETVWWARRRHLRGQQFACAKAEALKLGKPLVVVGAPDGVDYLFSIENDVLTTRPSIGA